MHLFKYTLLFLIISLAPSASVHAQNVSTQKTSFDRMVERFKEGKYPTRHFEFNYRYALLNPDIKGKAQMVVILHPSSYSGENNISQLRPPSVKRIVNYIEQSRVKTYIFVPQCRADRWWSEDYANLGDPMYKILKGAIDNFTINEDVDLSRIFIVGQSSGGAGVWKMVDRYPDFFACGFIVGSYPKNVSASRLRSTPLCISVGEKDRIVNVAQVQQFVEKIRKGGHVRYDVIPNSDGIAIQSLGFSKDNLEWVFSQSKARK